MQKKKKKLLRKIYLKHQRKIQKFFGICEKNSGVSGKCLLGELKENDEKMVWGGIGGFHYSRP